MMRSIVAAVVVAGMYLGQPSCGTAAKPTPKSGLILYDGCELPPPDPRAALLACKAQDQGMICLYLMTSASGVPGCLVYIKSTTCKSVEWKALSIDCSQAARPTL